MSLKRAVEQITFIESSFAPRARKIAVEVVYDKALDVVKVGFEQAAVYKNRFSQVYFMKIKRFKNVFGKSNVFEVTS